MRIKLNKEKGESTSWKGTIFNWVARENPTNTVTYDQKPEGGTGVLYTAIWRKAIPQNRRKQGQTSCGTSCA